MAAALADGAAGCNLSYSSAAAVGAAAPVQMRRPQEGQVRGQLQHQQEKHHYPIGVIWYSYHHQSYYYCHLHYHDHHCSVRLLLPLLSPFHIQVS
jgi:hypothetical protein